MLEKDKIRPQSDLSENFRALPSSFRTHKKPTPWLSFSVIILFASIILGAVFSDPEMRSEFDILEKIRREKISPYSLHLQIVFLTILGGLSAIDRRLIGLAAVVSSGFVFVSMNISLMFGLVLGEVFGELLVSRKLISEIGSLLRLLQYLVLSIVISIILDYAAALFSSKSVNSGFLSAWWRICAPFRCLSSAVFICISANSAYQLLQAA